MVSLGILLPLLLQAAGGKGAACRPPPLPHPHRGECQGGKGFVKHEEQETRLRTSIIKSGEVGEGASIPLVDLLPDSGVNSRCLCCQFVV